MSSSGALPLPAQILVLTRRMFAELFAAPGPLLGALALAPGYLILQDATFGRVAARAPGVDGDYLTFVVPGAVLIATIVSGNAGFAVLRDKEDRYLERLLTLPISSVAIAAAPLIFGCAFAIANAAVVIAVASAIGHAPATGAAGVAVMLAVAGLSGLAIAGLLVTVALVTGSIETVQLADLACFPLLFLSSLTLPQEELTGWLRALASINPTTYAVNGLRSLMGEDWDLSRVELGFAVAVLCAGAMLTAAALATRWSTTRG